jgi:ankyrin repeat protein
MKFEPLPLTATIDRYQQQAESLLAALNAGDEGAQWRFKWEHPRFRGKRVDEVIAAAETLGIADAQLVIAHVYAFDDWAALSEFTTAVTADETVARFERAVEAVIAGDASTLRALLRQHPDLARARSTRRHHATLLHYIAANGVEGHRQQTPPNAVEIAKLLLDAGAEVDALADMYENSCTTMSMLVSSSPPHAAGLQTALAETLLDHGAAFEGRGSNWQSAVQTALSFGFLDTAKALSRRGAPVKDIVTTAGLGRTDDVARLLASSDGAQKHSALALAAQHGHIDIVRLMLDAGEDPSRYNPDGFHSHSTPLHQAVWSDHMPVVRLLVERGARLDVRDKVYDGRPLEWAVYGKRTEIVDYLRPLTRET